MTDEPRIGPLGRDDDLTRALRAMYAAPTEAAYWNALTRRVMARIGEEDADWAAPLARWARIGVIAAGIALAVASFAISRARDAQTRMALQTIIETPGSAPLQIATESGTPGDRDATLQYVIAP